MLYDKEKALMSDVHETCCVKIQIKVNPPSCDVIHFT